MKAGRAVRWGALIALVVVVAAACQVVPQPMEDLGTLGGSDASAQAINDRGIVVGTSRTAAGPAGDSRAFRYDPDTGSMIDLGSLVAGGDSSAVDINDHDVAVGLANVPSHTLSELQHAVAFDPVMGIIDLHDALGNWHESGATAINDEGVVVGWAVRYFSLDLPFVQATTNFAYDMDTGEVTSLPLFPADINDSGLVVGTASGRAATYDLTTGTLTDLGTLGGSASSANAVNDAGVVVGAAGVPSGQQHAFRYDPDTGVMTDLRPVDGFSVADGVNDRGDVVGSGWDQGHKRAFFVWTANGSLTDLGTLDGSTLVEALDVNDDRVVVGTANVLGFGRAWRTTVQILPHEED